MSTDDPFSQSPPRPFHPHPTPRHFLPLSEDLVSTRGQSLPGLIQRNSFPARAPADESPYRKRTAYKRLSQDEEEANGEQRRRKGSVILESADWEDRERRASVGADALNTPQMRSMRLVGNSNPRYKWEQYFKTDEELKRMKKPIRKYYERNNFLIQQYMYIDRLLDSSLPHNLIQEYQQGQGTLGIPESIPEDSAPSPLISSRNPNDAAKGLANNSQPAPKIKRTPKALYRIPQEDTPLLENGEEEDGLGLGPQLDLVEDDDSGAAVVTLAIYVNLVANAILLAAKIAVIVLTSSLSVLASLVDAALDFLSTAIVWVTTRMIARTDIYNYPVGRRRLEPLGVLIFSVVMITSFAQISLESINRLTSTDHSIVELTLPSVIIMASTVVIKFACWLWCRLIKNSSVQALAQDAMTDVVFNTFSIIFPLVGYYARIWWMDSVGGLLLSLYVIINWSRTSISHIRNLSGAAASSDERNVLLYLTMRFAKTIRQIQGLQAYHAGDKLIVEVDIVVDENMPLRDSHDLGESLQYVLESVPNVDRSFVHLDYASWNLPTHMEQHE